MRPNGRAVYHHHIHVMRLGDRVNDRISVASLAPTIETVVDRRRRAVSLWHISPWNASTQNVENPVDHTTVIHPFHTTRLDGKHRPDKFPFQSAHISSRHFPASTCCCAGNESQAYVVDKELIGVLPRLPLAQEGHLYCLDGRSEKNLPKISTSATGVP